MRRLTGRIALQEKGLDTLKGREQAARDAQARTVTQRMAQSAARRQRIEAALTLKHSYLAGGVDTVEMEASFGPMQKGHLFLRSLLQQIKG